VVNKTRRVAPLTCCLYQIAPTEKKNWQYLTGIHKYSSQFFCYWRQSRRGTCTFIWWDQWYFSELPHPSGSTHWLQT